MTVRRTSEDFDDASYVPFMVAADMDEESDLGSIHLELVGLRPDAPAFHPSALRHGDTLAVCQFLHCSPRCIL